MGYVDGEEPDDPFAECSEDESVSSEGTNNSDHNEDPVDDTRDEDPFEQTDSDNDATDSDSEDKIRCDLTIEDLTDSSEDDSRDI